MLKIRVMNISKKDLGKTLKKYKGTAWDQSPIFKKLYEQEYGQLGGEPYGCAGRRLLLRSHAAAMSSCSGRWRRSPPPHTRRSSPAAAPTLMGMDSWQELANPRDLGQDLLDARVRRLALAARVGRRQVRRACDAALPRASALWREDRARSRSSTSRKRRRSATTASTPGRMPPMRWPSTSTVSFKIYGWCSCDTRCGVRRCGRRTAGATRSRATTAA